MNELTKMNLIAIVQQLPDEDIEFVQTYITLLEDKLKQKEHIIKEVREYVKNDDNFFIIDSYSQPILDRIQEDILEILDKENNNE